MKSRLLKSLLRSCAALLCATVCMPVCGQSLTISDPGYTQTKLFDSTAGYTITGMAADDLGNIYYIESDTSLSGDTKLYKRSALDNYATATPLYNLGGGLNGAFVVFASGRLYFGENTNGSIYSINTDGTGADVLGVLAGNYDAAFSGGRLFVSHDVGTFDGSRVTRFDLIADGSGGFMLGNSDVIVDASGDYYGALEYSGGELYYGASGYTSVKGLYRFTAAEVTGAIGPGELLLDMDHEFGATTTNFVGALAFGSGTDLWKDEPFSQNLLLFDRFNGGVSTIGNATGNSTLGQLDFANNSLFVNVTDFNVGQSAIFKVAVPEPTASALLLAGLPALFRRRR